MTHRSLRFGADLNLHVEVPQLPQLPNFPQLIARKFNGLRLVEVEGTATSSSTSSTCQATDLIGKNEVEELREFRPPTGCGRHLKCAPTPGQGDACCTRLRRLRVSLFLLVPLMDQSCRTDGGSMGWKGHDGN